MRHVPVWSFLFVSAIAGAVGCSDPNPTFVFDAATPAKDGGSDATDAGTIGDAGGDAADGGVDAPTGDAP